MVKKSTILIVEDDTRLRGFMSSSLEKAEYNVLEAPCGKAAFEILRNELIDLVLLDLRLGDVDGMEILKTIRRQDDELPVIIVSSIEDQDSKVNGFDIGCDDYIIKPFYIEELLGRVRRLLRRPRVHPVGLKIVTDRIRSGPFELDIRTQSLRKNDSLIPLRKKLFDLFLYFIRHPDRIISNEILHDHLWGSTSDLNENSLYVHIRQLRTLVEDNPSDPRYIIRIPKAGYIYSPDPGAGPRS